MTRKTNICCTTNQFIFPIHNNCNTCALAMAIVTPKVLRISLPKFHDGNDAVAHVGRLAKVCVTNGEDNDALNYSIFLQRYKENCELVYPLCDSKSHYNLGSLGVHLFQDLVMCTTKDKP